MMDSGSRLHLLLSEFNNSTSDHEVERVISSYCSDYCKNVFDVDDGHILSGRIIGNSNARYFIASFKSEFIASSFAHKNNLNTFGFTNVVIKLHL